MAVRSNYIKNLMESKNSLEKQYQEVITESMKNIIGENAKDEVRKLLKEEDEDSFDEEEVETDTAPDNEDEVVDTEEDTDFDSVDDEESDEVDDASDDVWNDLEKCKGADGEYDCRGMGDEKLLTVLKAMGPEDGIRVMSNGDGTVSVEVDGNMIDGEQEFIIDLDDFDADTESDDFDVDTESDDFDADTESDDDDSEFEVELNEDLGYKGHPGNGGYQHDDVLTGPKDGDDSRLTNKKDIHTWEPDLDNAHINNGKDGDRQPYSKNVNEDVDECGTVSEIEEDGGQMIDETEGARPNWNNVRKKLAKDNQGDTQFPRMGSKNGELKKGSGEPVYSSVNESVDFKKKVNRLWEENRQMKSIIPQLNDKLMESMVINASMGYIVRLLNENSTTVEEKKQISERFTKVNTLEEGKKLYETISEELRNANRRNNLNGIINGQLAEGKQTKQNLVETTMYKSEKVNEALDFMKRLDSIK